MGKRGDRLAIALSIRNAAIDKIYSEGKFKSLQGYHRARAWEGPRLSMLHRTPSEPLPLPADPRLIAMLEQDPKIFNLGYGLDIWDKSRRKKVFNLEWDEGGEVRIIAFHRGDWEAEVLAWGPIGFQLGNATLIH